MSKIVPTQFEKHLEIERKHMTRMHKELGEMYGYPDCCIEQFTREVLLGVAPFQFRQLVHRKVIPATGYVPCDKCMEKIV